MEKNDIAIILVKPQLAENIGAVARAMLNFGLTDLRLVNPRQDVAMDKALAMSAHASKVIENSVTYNSFDDAVKDRKNLYATTARKRDMQKEVISSNHLNSIDTEKAAVVFGCEASGLDNDDLSKCDYIISIPANNDYSSLNLAQAVIIIAYELNKNRLSTPAKPSAEKASKEELFSLYNDVERRLEKANFYQDINKKPKMDNNIRSIFNKAQLTSQEVRTLRGIFNKISGFKL